ncbi:flagellar assembly protein T N-terminal domain-containing protein [Marinobacterium sediminicola]|uniref:Flagellar assembly protein T, N-terminal domain n=1 Tax=Marinobacterium sediminicola TaxID=518898 RepID=A0ABY1S0V4_9GAMM|nr:flagellar assembly protein T N-terminal domain-containing protein [Marinobacterium sediminicola]ULG69677.1 flagellar assembly protein FlgT [Marinobacterium sediminicola]SMR74595.1 Flagellar assembly protein T, N-terminal domain [Marinobacterium sediminicola]
MKQLAAALLHLLTLTLLLLPSQASAVSIEATGQAPYVEEDPGLSRQQALQRAMEQASIRASAWLSGTRQARDGVLEIDTLRLSTLGKVSNVRVIDEQVRDDQISVTIIADVDIAQGCKDSLPQTAYRKSLAITHFPLENPADANNGQLHEIQQGLATLLAYELQRSSTFEALDAGNLNIIGDPTQAPVRLLPEGTLTTILNNTPQHQVQYLISGVIRGMAPHYTPGPREPNVLVDLYRQFDREQRFHQRDLVLDLFIHDAFTGALKHQQRYHMTADWNADSHAKVGFGTPQFWQQPFGQQLRSVIRAVSNDIQLQLTCEPFTARITRTRDKEVWISAGSLDGLKPGDRLSVYRRLTHYDGQMRPEYELINTEHNLTLTQTQPSFSKGTLDVDSETLNIQQDDIVIAH